jgi:hypothetical protein
MRFDGAVNECLCVTFAIRSRINLFVEKKRPGPQRLRQIREWLIGLLAIAVGRV